MVDCAWMCVCVCVVDACMSGWMTVHVCVCVCVCVCVVDACMSGWMGERDGPMALCYTDTHTHMQTHTHIHLYKHTHTHTLNQQTTTDLPTQ
jgi:hypothetical protein